MPFVNMFVELIDWFALHFQSSDSLRLDPFHTLQDILDLNLVLLPHVCQNRISKYLVESAIP
jgi:hypothetical protein